MNYPFTIKDISSKVKKSEQSLYTLIKKNQDFFKQNSHKQGRFTRYNQAALDWFMEYYGTAQEQEPQNTPETAQKSLQDVAENQEEELSLQQLKTKIAVLEAENAALHERLAASEEERKELRQQVGMALSALQQEKQEKMLLLPAPRKTIAEKVKVFFSGHNKKGQENS